MMLQMLSSSGTLLEILSQELSRVCESLHLNPFQFVYSILIGINYMTGPCLAEFGRTKCLNVQQKILQVKWPTGP